MKFPSLFLAVFLTVFSFACPQRADAGQAAPVRNVLASTYPVWLLTRAVTDGVPDTEVQLLVAAATGCPHDYAPTPADLLRLEKADLVIINGLGLEAPFHDALARRGADVLDCGAGLGKALEAYEGTLPAAACGQTHHGHDHTACESNPHIFAGPRLAARMVESIAGELARRDPAHAARYPYKGGVRMNVYLTGDTHGRFERIACFCRDNHTTLGDVLIILGDAGVNYYLNHRDEKLKQYIDTMPVTLLCIHGNHEARPTAALGYEGRAFLPQGVVGR